MTIAMSNGITYENSLDMLFAKDMPSREETQGKMPAVPEPPRLPDPDLAPMNEEDQLHPNQPMDMATDTHKTPESNFEAVMRGLGEISDQAMFKGPGYKRSQRYFQNVQARPQDKESNAPLSQEDWKDFWNSSGSRQLLQGPQSDKTLEKNLDNNPKGFLVDRKNLDIHGLDRDKYEILEPPDDGHYSKQFLFIRPKKQDAVVGEADLPPNARQTVAETPEPSTYEKFVNHLEKARDFLEPSFIPTPEVFRDAPWREKLGSIIATSLMFMTPGRGFKVTPGETPGPGSNALDFWKEGLAEYDKINPPIIKTLELAEKGGSEVAGRLLEQYRKIDNPVMRQEFGQIVKDKIRAAAEGGETAPSNITNPEIKGEPPTPGPNKKWTPDELSILEKWIKDPNGDLMETPKELSHRSETAIFARAKQEGWIEKAQEKYKRQPGDSKKPFVPEGAVSAPETGGGSGGGNEYGPHNPNRFAEMTPDEASSARAAFEKDMIGKYGLTGKRGAKSKMFELMTEAENQQHRDYTARIYDYPGSDVSGTPKETVKPYNVTETRGKTGFDTFTPSKERKAANSNTSLQIDDPVMEAAIDKSWENFGRANRDNLPLISPAIESKLQEMNPVGFKKLKQFELEMDYKYKQPPGRRHWLSDLTEAEADRYRKLYNDIDKIRPVK